MTSNTAAFAVRWADEKRERAETQSYWNDLYATYGLDRRDTGVQYDYPVKDPRTGGDGFIDVLHPGTLLVEHKSAGRNFDKAEEQAFAYHRSLPETMRPRYVIVCDFQRFRVIDTHAKKSDTERTTEFFLTDLGGNPDLFGRILAHRDTTSAGILIDLGAANLMADLYEEVARSGASSHDLSMLLTRILFCLYAEDTDIFVTGAFHQIVADVPAYATAATLARVFDVLNTPDGSRDPKLSGAMAGLPYVNGDLFAINITIPEFDEGMRDALLRAANYNWGDVNPTIFGALFQNASDPQKRRELGEHYTSETNILRTLNPLILDELEAEFTRVQGNGAGLARLHERIAALKFLDPAAGCGNFLVVAYKALRQLEFKIYKERIKVAGGKPGSRGNTQLLRDTATMGVATLFPVDARNFVRVEVENFHGIEIEEFPVKIAEVALYLEQHRQDRLLSGVLGAVVLNLPLASRAHMVHANAATTDWGTVVAPSDDLIIVGNPPYLGANSKQGGPSEIVRRKRERDAVWQGAQNSGKLDYVTIWFKKAADHVRGTKARVAFVSTNSVHQGEQVAPFWGTLRDMGMKINFAHRTFSWKNEANGMAHVHVVIVGFSHGGTGQKVALFDYPDINEEPVMSYPATINAYLTGGTDVVVHPRMTPLTVGLSTMLKGTEFTDGVSGRHGTEKYQGLILDAIGRREAMADPFAAKYVRELIGTDEFISGDKRWCLWLVDADLKDVRGSAVIRRRAEFVRSYRSGSTRVQTLRAAGFPTLPTINAHQKTINGNQYLVVPRVNSERRNYTPAAFVTSNTITTDSANAIYQATLFDFAVVSSRHMRLWSEAVAGRLESRIRFGARTTWNTFPLPTITDTQRERIETAAQKVLDNRTPGKTLAELYDPLVTPQSLLKAHKALDRELDTILGLKNPTDTERLAALFDLYAAVTTK